MSAKQVSDNDQSPVFEKQEIKTEAERSPSPPAQQSKDELKGTGKAETMPPQSYKTLRFNEIARVDYILSQRNDNIPIFLQNGCEMRLRDLRTLANDNWVNDAVINSYMQLIVDRSVRNSFRLHCGRIVSDPKIRTLPIVCAFSTYFATKMLNSPTEARDVYKRYVYLLKESLPENTKEATAKEFDDFNLHNFNKENGGCETPVDMFIMPVFTNNHWLLMLIFPKTRTIQLIDSTIVTSIKSRMLFKISEPVLEFVRLVDDIHPEEWKKVMAEDIPQQENDCDCGVFVCLFAECYSRRTELELLCGDIPWLRKKIMYDLISKCIQIS
ncbi:hypothetical protein GJ496_005606 [Pomphorhynchus laevis]|nr:hypothetical protein GJ496_005606 [Pomphorhynchus laevis]